MGPSDALQTFRRSLYDDCLRRRADALFDLASTDPWQPRGIEVRGRAEAVEEPRPLIRIHPERIVSWGVDTGGFQRTARSVG